MLRLWGGLSLIKMTNRPSFSLCRDGILCMPVFDLLARTSNIFAFSIVYFRHGCACVKECDVLNESPLALESRTLSALVARLQKQRSFSGRQFVVYISSMHSYLSCYLGLDCTLDRADEKVVGATTAQVVMFARKR